MPKIDVPKIDVQKTANEGRPEDDAMASAATATIDATADHPAAEDAAASRGPWVRYVMIPNPLQPTVAAATGCGLFFILMGQWWSPPPDAHRLHALPQIQIDPNTASWPELSLLPNVGEGLSRRMVDFRQRVGPFDRQHGLDGVSGIGPHRMAAIRPYLAQEHVARGTPAPVE